MWHSAHKLSALVAAGHCLQVVGANLLYHHCCWGYLNNDRPVIVQVVPVRFLSLDFKRPFLVSTGHSGVLPITG